MTGSRPAVAGASQPKSARPAYATDSKNAGDAEEPQTPSLDPAVLEGILKAVLEAQGDRATPEHLATLTVDLYQRAMTIEPRE